MSYIPLTSEKYIKEETILHENVDSKLIRVAIRDAQEIHTRDKLGSALYDQILTEVSGASLTAANTTLLNTYIAPMQRYYVLMEVVVNLQFKLANSSVLIRDAENARPATANDLEMLEDKYATKADYYYRRLRKFICDNITDYPLYNSGDQAINPDKSGLNSSTMFLNDV